MEERTIRIRPLRKRRTGSTLLIAAALLTLIAYAGGGPPLAPRASADVSPALAPADAGERSNGNFTIYHSEPAFPAVPGTVVRAQFIITVVTAPANSTPLEIWVPGTLAIFYGPNASMKLTENSFSFQFLPGGSNVSNATNLTGLLSFTGGFNQTEPAFLSTQTAALMANRPFGSVTLSVSWHWLLGNPDGSVISGPWSPGTLLQPASFADLASSGPSSVTPGGSFGVCLAGPIEGRTFSLILETTAQPIVEFAQVTQTANTSAVLCWSATVPTWIQPQGIVAHVWDEDRVTMLLYIIDASVANVMTPVSALLGLVSSLAGAVTLGALVIGCVVIVVNLVRWRRRKLVPPPSVPGGSM